jgi:RNA-binding protein
MRTLTSASRRALRAKAHHLHPFVSIGQHGLTPAVLHEIDVNLLAHELIKIRVFGDDRTERERLLAQICAGLDAAAVQHLGKTLTVWRPAPEPERAAGTPKSKPAAAARKARPVAGGSGAGASAKPRARTGETMSRPGAKPNARTAQAKAKGRPGGPKPNARTAATPGTRRRRVPR